MLCLILSRIQVKRICGENLLPLQANVQDIGQISGLEYLFDYTGIMSVENGAALSCPLFKKIKIKK